MNNSNQHSNFNRQQSVGHHAGQQQSPNTYGNRPNINKQDFDAQQHNESFQQSNTNGHIHQGASSNEQQFYDSNPTNSGSFGREPLNSKPEFERPDWFLQLKSHGGKCALQVETSKTKDDWFTVNLESATKESADTNNKRFNWKNKTTFQLTRNELPVFIAVLLGMLPSCKLDGHGEQMKFLEVANQGKSFFFKIGGIGLPLHTIPVPIAEAYMFGTLALGQFARNFNGMTPEAALDIIGRMANQMFTNDGYKQASSR